MKTKTKALITLVVIMLLGSTSYEYVEIETGPIHYIPVYVKVDFNHQNYSGHNRILDWVNATWTGNVDFKTFCYTQGGAGIEFCYLGTNYTGALSKLTYDQSHNIGLGISFEIPMYISNTHFSVFNNTSISDLKCLGSNETIVTGFYSVLSVGGPLCEKSNNFGGFNVSSNQQMIYIKEAN